MLAAWASLVVLASAAGFAQAPPALQDFPACPSQVAASYTVLAVQVGDGGKPTAVTPLFGNRSWLDSAQSAAGDMTFAAAPAGAEVGVLCGKSAVPKIGYVFDASALQQQGTSLAHIAPAIAEELAGEKVEGKLPAYARARYVRGPVQMLVFVTETGTVAAAFAQSGSSELIHAAADAARQWKFRPYVPAGKARPFETSITIRFTNTR
ncbi:MAG TPA: energy transducer TonB [Terriglobales bacterium]|jgi:TonB family protein